MEIKSLSETRFLGKLAVAKRLGISRSTLDVWRREDPTFPKPVMLSAFTMRWDILDIDAWAVGKKESANDRKTP